jgi:hypothetical protein
MPASYGGASGASLPDTPDDVLLDFANRGKAIILDQTTGEGLALSVATLLEGATGEATESAASGDWLVGDGAGGAQLASAAPGDVRAVLGVPSALQTIPLFAYATADKAVATVQALAGFTPADYAITGSTTVLALDAIGSVTSGSQTGTLEVLNAAGTTVATLSWTETTPTRKTTSVTLPGSAEIWRARVSCAGVTDPLTDYALLGGAHVRITWS